MISRTLLCGFISVTMLTHVTAAALPASPAKFLPRENKSDFVPPLRTAFFDFLLPGYGTFMQNQTGYAAFYFGANIASLAGIYMAYRNWRFYESAYQAAFVRQAQEPDKLQFQDPAGGGDFYTLQDIRNRADRGQLFFAISIVANLALRAVSAYHTWSLADETLKKSGPRYEFYPDTGGMHVRGSYDWRF